MAPLFFKKPIDLRNWFEKNHKSQSEIWVGFYKKGTKLESITWPESVDEALCVGWIDGIRKSIDEKSYQIRFTPRKIRSHWSKVNIDRMPVLEKLKKMKPAGREAFDKMNPDNAQKAAHEQKNIILDPNYEKELKSNDAAWEFFNNKSPSFKKQCIWWVMSAKQEKTRLKRLKILIEASQNKEVIPPLKWAKK